MDIYYYVCVCEYIYRYTSEKCLNPFCKEYDWWIQIKSVCVCVSVHVCVYICMYVGVYVCVWVVYGAVCVCVVWCVVWGLVGPGSVCGVGRHRCCLTAPPAPDSSREGR